MSIVEENQENQITEKSSNNNILYLGIAVVIIVVVGGLFVMRNKNKPVPPETTVLGEMAEPTQSVVNEGFDSGDSNELTADIKTFEVEAGSFYYNPKEIRVKQGDTVIIKLTAKDLQHDLNIDALGVDGDIVKAGETTVIEFEASDIGTFEYYCSVGNHRSMGQVGKLIIE